VRGSCCRCNALSLESAPWLEKLQELYLTEKRPGPTRFRPRQTRSYCVAYSFPCTVCKTSSALLKVSLVEFLT
jgi:hypothetical protein